MFNYIGAALLTRLVDQRSPQPRENPYAQQQLATNSTAGARNHAACISSGFVPIQSTLHSHDVTSGGGHPHVIAWLLIHWLLTLQYI